MDIVIKNVTLSYPNLFEMKAKPGSDRLCYSVTCLIPKSDVDTKKKLDSVIHKVYEENKSDKLKGVKEERVAVTVYDGDGETPKGNDFGEECKGHWVLRANNYKRQPGVVDKNFNDVIDTSKVYAGVKAHVDLSVYAYKADMSRGISFGLSNVMVLGEGEPIAGTARSAAEAFKGLGSSDEDIFG